MLGRLFDLLFLVRIVCFDDTYLFHEQFLLGILLFASFLSWASVIRSASHLGYLVGILELDNAPADDIRVQDAECGMSLTPVNEEAVDVAESPISKLDEAKRIGSVMLLSFRLVLLTTLKFYCIHS